MTDTRPSPLVPAEVDLRDFGFMPLDVRRLLTSETWIEAAENPRLGHALVSLWSEAWHQVPAGSLPDNDRVLQRLSMCPTAKEWAKVRERALAGWVKCSDGLLYHPVVAEKALDSWAKKCAQRERTKAATEARQRHKRQRDEQRNENRNGERDEQRNENRNGERDEQRNESRYVHQGRVKGEGDSKPLQDAPTDSNEVAPPQPAAPPAPEPAKGTRSGAVAILLRNLGVKVTPMHPDCIAWAEQGVTDDQLRQAVGLARVSKPDPIPIPASYLKPIVLQVTAPTTATPSAQGARNGKFNVHAYGRELLAEELAAQALGNRPASEAGTALQPQVHELLPRSGNRE